LGARETCRKAYQRYCEENLKRLFHGVWLPSWLATASCYLRFPWFFGGTRRHAGRYLSLELMTHYLKSKTCLCFTATNRRKIFDNFSVMETLSLILRASAE
jgi:hypothetical protein